MKIVSKRKDYFDSLSHTYGEDPHVTFFRKSVPNTRVPVPAHIAGKFKRGDLKKTSLTDGRRQSICFAVVGSRVFPLLSTKIPNPPHRDDVQDVLLSEDHRDLLSYGHTWNPITKELQKLSLLDVPVKLSPDDAGVLLRAVGSPVFVIERADTIWPRSRRDQPEHYVWVREHVPVLGDIKGMAAALPREDAWKTIYTALTDLMRRDPDRSPPVEVSNDAKIVKAGFDTKTSFRGKTK